MSGQVLLMPDNFCIPSDHEKLKLHVVLSTQELLKLPKSHSNIFIKAGCTYIGCNVKIGYSVQGLVAKVKDTVAKWLYFWLVCGEPLQQQIVIICPDVRMYIPHGTKGN